MEKINFRFLNYKHYNKFSQDLAQDKVRKDAIVFIQDKPCIWARGKEYVCDGQYTSNIEGNILTFKNNSDDVIFTLSLSDGTITFTDSNGNAVTGSYVLDKTFSDTITDIRRSIETKLEKLTARYPIFIDNNVIGANIDVELYVIVTELPDASLANTNKIYLHEVPDGNGGFKYNQYRVRNGQWVPIGGTQLNVDLSRYLKSETAALLYQPIGNYLTSVDLTGYAKLTDIEDLHINNFVQLEYLRDNYALKSWVEDTFVKKSNVYDPDLSSGLGESTNSNPSSGGIVIPSAPTVIVDSILDETSSNAIENRAVTIALRNRATKEDLREYAKKTDLNSKADTSVLDNYVTATKHQLDIDTKQDILTAGRGISIINNVISSTLDTNIYIIIQELPESGDPNKIYLLESYDDGTPIYTEYKWDVDRGWIEQRQINPEIDLSGYLTRSDAATTYQPVGDYATRTEVNNAHQDIVDNYATNEELETVDNRFNDYSSKDDLESLRENINNAFLRKGDYAIASDVATAFLILQLIIDQKYVLKKDVYIPPKGKWSAERGTPISIAGASGGVSLGGGSSLITLTEKEYLLLVENDMIDDSVYYFTYEGEINWTFGGTFPITLAGEGIGTLPITLT